MSGASTESDVRIGLFGVGLDAYWPQFDGLHDRLLGYLDQVSRRIGQSSARVVDVGLVDSPEKAFEAGHRFRREDVELIFLHVTTYALSSTVLPVVRRARVPVIVLNLQPCRRRWITSVSTRWGTEPQ
jgi:L-arabinose isomerase